MLDGPTPRPGPQYCVGGDPRVGAAPPEPQFALNGAVAVPRERFVTVSAERRRARTRAPGGAAGGSGRGSVHLPTRPAKKMDAGDPAGGRAGAERVGGFLARGHARPVCDLSGRVGSGRVLGLGVELAHHSNLYQVPRILDATGPPRTGRSPRPRRPRGPLPRGSAPPATPRRPGRRRGAPPARRGRRRAPRAARGRPSGRVPARAPRRRRPGLTTTH